jgi:alkylation response protein AidB-like acyl-CoA dehydrogenase
MLARTELARAAVWDAARALGEGPEGGAAIAVATGAALAFDAAFTNAKDCVQTLGGIGFTWEHDAHLYLRRATTLHQLLGAPDEWRVRAARAALTGERRRLTADLPAEAEAYRDELRAYLGEIKPLDKVEQRNRLAADGYVTPGWPKPWGRDASSLELLVIEEEFRAARVVRPNIGVGSWALPNLIVHGTEEQRERWILPTLRGEIMWCQLFSEPGAGSDLASLSTRATRVEGGWVLNGQKVWTSMAQMAQWGICLARTDPDAPKHDGISCFMVDMSTPGIDIRPLRELTGAAMFNEVFFDDVFVPEDCLVGRENDGWRAARTTLANERVYMGGSNTMGAGVTGVLRTLEAEQRSDDRLALCEVGSLVATAHALAVLGFRLTLQALAGADPSGSEAAVRKLLGVQHDQRVQEVGLTLSGPDGAAEDGDAAGWSAAFLFNRCLTIAGGTSDVQRNVIAERLLGLPRDP